MGASIFTIQRVLAEMPEERLPAFKLTARAGTTMDDFYKHVGKWLARGHLSRERIKGKGWHYFLTEAQKRTFLLRRELQFGAAAASDIRKLSNVDALLDREQITLAAPRHDIPGRLTFLRMLRDKTIYGDHAALTLIIEDYERAARTHDAREDRTLGKPGRRERA